MADEWMSASEAFVMAREAVGNAHGASAIFDHVASGLIEAKAEKVTVEDAYGDIRQAEAVHPKFWSSTHVANVDQMWTIGTLISFIPEDIGDGAYAWMGGPARIEKWQAFGVKFNREQVISHFAPAMLAGAAKVCLERASPKFSELEKRAWIAEQPSMTADAAHIVFKQHPRFDGTKQEQFRKEWKEVRKTQRGRPPNNREQK